MSSVVRAGKETRSRAAFKVFGGLAGLLLVVLALAGSCKKYDIIVDEILIDKLGGIEGQASREEMREWAKKAVSSQGKFKLRMRDEGPGVLRLKVGMDKKGDAGSKRLFLLARYENAEKIEDKLESYAVLPLASNEKFEKIFHDALNENFVSLLTQIAIKKAEEFDLLAVLHDNLKGKKISEEKLVLALQKASMEKDPKMAEAVAQTMNNANLKISVLALSTLGSLGNSESIDAISQFAEHKDSEIRRHAIEAARKIGGVKAAAWLFTLSTGHADERVRDAAQFALADVERRLSKTL